MRLASRYLAIVLATTGGACASNPVPPAVPPATSGTPELAVPLGDAPVVDGKVDEAPWSRAAVIALDRGVTLRVMHDRARVYLGISGLTPPSDFGFACVLVAEPDQIRVLHASAKLGSAIYTAGADGRYHPRAKAYDWRAADVLMRDEGWMATTVAREGAREQEFALTFAALGLPDHPRRIALGYFHITPDATGPSQPGAVVWPRGLDDAVANVQLLGGFNPDGLQFDPDRWVVLRPTTGVSHGVPRSRQ